MNPFSPIVGEVRLARDTDLVARSLPRTVWVNKDEPQSRACDRLHDLYSGHYMAEPPNSWLRASRLREARPYGDYLLLDAIARDTAVPAGNGCFFERQGRGRSHG